MPVQSHHAPFITITAIIHLQRHVLFGLRIEGRVDDLAADEDPHVILDLKGFDVDVGSLFFLLLDDFDELLAEQFRHVIHVATAFRRRDTKEIRRNDLRWCGLMRTISTEEKDEKNGMAL